MQNRFREIGTIGYLLLGVFPGVDTHEVETLHGFTHYDSSASPPTDKAWNSNVFIFGFS